VNPVPWPGRSARGPDPPIDLSGVLPLIASHSTDSLVDPTEAGLMATLRRGRQEVALLVALADLGGVWDVVDGDRRR
jgi:hypothetical protein